MENLLDETILAINLSNHSVGDVMFIGSSDGKYSCTWPEFVKIANMNYDSGYGSAVVASDLVIVFYDDRKMWRSEYDGSEWWEWSNPLTVDFTKTGKSIANLISHEYGNTVSELNKES